MPAPRFLRQVAGVLTEILGLQTSAGAGDADKIVATGADGRLDGTLMPGGAPVNTSAGAADAGKLPKLDAGGKLAQTMMPAGVGPDSLSIPASENLAAGDLVNLWNDAGTVKARKADATTAGKEAHGFTDAAVTAPASATVYFDGQISGLTGLTIGRQFLATTAGGKTATAPNTSGNVVQQVGFATSTTTMTFEAGTPITVA